LTLHIIKAMNRASFTWTENGETKRFREVTREDELYARFYIDPIKLLKVDWYVGADPNQPGRPRCMTPAAINFDPTTTPGDALAGIARLAHRGVRRAVLEWIRTHPDQTVPFLAQVGKDDRYRRHFSPLYDAIRLMMQRVTDAPVISILEVEAVLQRRSQEVLAKASRLTEEASKVHQERVAREAWVLDMIKKGDSVERSHWLERMPPMTTVQTKPRSGRQARSRSRSRGPSGSQTRNPSSAPPPKRLRK